MGMNVVVLFRMDAMAAIESQPTQTIRGISNAIIEDRKTDVTIIDGLRTESNAITVMPTKHSSDVIVYVASGNTIYEVSAGSIQRDPRLRENLLKQLKEVGFLPASFKTEW
jgi:hypothetical protein